MRRDRQWDFLARPAEPKEANAHNLRPQSTGAPTRPNHEPPPTRRLALWAVALVLTLTSAAYQRATGPTHDLRGTYRVGFGTFRYDLSRSGTSTRDESVTIPAPAAATGSLHFRRYPLEEPWSTVPMKRVDDGLLGALLPRQPAAGKLEYFLTIDCGGESIRVPGTNGGGGPLSADPLGLSDDTIIIRFKNPVPAGLLIPHVVLMFFAILIGLHAGVAAVFAPSLMRRSAGMALIGMTLGGMVFGPLVQWRAFGALWTGFPFGYDLTDNKTLIMWLVWLVTWAILYRPSVRLGNAWPHRLTGRMSVIAATVVMMIVYMIPHSMRGSELDYSGLDPATGRVRTDHTMMCP